METNSENRGFLLLFSGKDWDQGLSDEELREAMDRYTDWTNSLIRSGKVKGGQVLARQGRTVSGPGRNVVDGPFAESKEAIGGYIHVLVDTFEDALQIAQACPGLDFGGSIQIRPVLEECPVWKRAAARLNGRQPNFSASALV